MLVAPTPSPTTRRLHMQWTSEQAALFEARIESITTLALRAKSATISIAHISATTAEAIGSGVLLKIGDARLVLSCAHVIEHQAFGGKGTDMQLIGPEGTSHVTGRVEMNAFDAARRGREDHIDAAVVRLAPECEDPPGSTYLTLADLHRDIAPKSEMLCLGFPLKKARVDVVTRTADVEPVTYISTTVAPDRQITPRFALDVNIAFDMEHKRARLPNGEERTLPQFNGMSGGGVWRYRLRDGWALNERARLVGIFTEYRPQRHLGIATKVAVHLKIISDAWPDLGRVVALHDGTPRHQG